MGRKQTVGEAERAWLKKWHRSKEYRKLSTGKKIGLRFTKFPDGRIVYGPVWWTKLSNAIDAAIRRAVKEAYDTGHSAAWQRAAGNLAGETSRKNIIEKKYGVKL